MTKEEIETVIIRYTFIVDAIKNNKDQAVFYVGNRKFSVKITDPVYTVCSIIRDVYSSSKDDWFKFMIDGILSDKTDVSLIIHLPWQRNAYYKRKDIFFNTVLLCCAARNIFTYEEILAGVAYVA